jgi:hypothetical protein
LQTQWRAMIPLSKKRMSPCDKKSKNSCGIKVRYSVIVICCHKAGMHRHGQVVRNSRRIMLWTQMTVVSHFLTTMLFASLGIVW